MENQKSRLLAESSVEEMIAAGTLIQDIPEVPMARVIDPERVNWEAEGLIYEPDIQYGYAGGRALMMDIMYPPREEKKHPVVIWVHGGGWSDEKLTRLYRPEKEMAHLCKMGFVCASIDYRLSQHAPFPAQIEDCKEAVRYLRANAEKYGIDAEHFGAWGESAGGHLVELMAVTNDEEFIRGENQEYSSRIQAAVPWYAPKDMRKSIQEMKQNENWARLFAAETEEKSLQLMEAASPIAYAERKNPPMLLMHGRADKLVSVMESVEYHRALTAAGNDAELVLIPGQGHGFFEGQEYYDVIYHFLEETLCR